MLQFNEEKHLYRIKETGELLTSVTTLIEKHKRPFPETPHAALNLKIAGHYGNAVHLMFEMWHEYGVKTKNPHLLKILDSYIELGHERGISELQIYSEKRKAAGTVDLLLPVAKGVYRMVDYKSTANPFQGTPGVPHKKTGVPNKGSSFGTRDSPLYGFNKKYELSPTNASFALQTSAYKLILEEEYDIKIEGIDIVHVDIDKECVNAYEIPYVKECEMLFDK